MGVEKVNGIVCLNYQDLVDGKDLSESINEAYSFDGLGILMVKGVPNFAEKRKRLLPLAHKYANMPEEVKAKTVHEKSHYSFGWSHGKEFLEGKPDFLKGSFYANPQYDRPVDDEALINTFPSFCHPNIWPTEDLPDLEHAFKDLGQLIVSVGEMIAAQADKFVEKRCPTYTAGKLKKIVNTSRVCKARLLHYFPNKDGVVFDESNMSSWCGWHNDHGSLTGLCPGMYIDGEGNECENPDKKAGLYIQSRNGDVVKAGVPVDCMAFQIGETAQIHSGGVLQATPHCVRASSGPGTETIAREAFAVFMEPEWDEPMSIPEGTTPEEAKKGSSHQYLPPGVPVLEVRWQATQDFGTFTDQTLKSYYEAQTSK